MDGGKLFRIGDMAALFHLSVSSIRHYEKLGLLTPEYVDGQTGYRYYSTRQFEAFNTICYLRALDMPLEEIADFLRNRDVETIQEKLRRQREAVREKQRELERIARKIDNRLRMLDEARHAELGVIRAGVAPACKLFRMEKSLQIREVYDMEEPTIGLAQAQSEAVIFLGKVGVSITKEHLLAGRFDQYDGIFLLLDAEDRFEGEVLELPEQRCVTLRFRGSHPEAPEQYRRLMADIRARGLRVSGPSREITMIDYGITNDTEKFVTEITIPVAEA